MPLDNTVETNIMRVMNSVAWLSLLIVSLGCAPQKPEPARKAAGEISSRDPQVAQRSHRHRRGFRRAAGAAAVPQLATALG